MVLVPHFQNVDETSHEARLSPGSCTVDNKQLQLSTFRVQSCSAWPKPILLIFPTSATPVSIIVPVKLWLGASIPRPVCLRNYRVEVLGFELPF